MNDRGGGFWNRLFGSSPAAPAHSFEELKRVHEVLLDPANQVVNSQNESTLIEALRATAELLIWGDQNDPHVFEYFLEHNMLKHFKRILEVHDHRRGDVAVQLLQTLSILISNISNKTSLFFLFSNNHLNDIIALNYDLRDEELLAHYITLLKTISFKLNEETIQFFFQVDATTRPHFPLYTEAMKLFNHPDGMVRAAVRMLTINVYKVGDDKMLEFVASAPCSSYFDEVALHLKDRVVHFDRKLEALQSGHAGVMQEMNSLMAEVEDYMTYVGDVLEVATARLRSEVSRKFWEGFVEPAVLCPLLDTLDAPPPAAGGRSSVRVVSALYSVERAFAQLRSPSMVEALACALLAGSNVLPRNNFGAIFGDPALPDDSSALPAVEEDVAEGEGEGEPGDGEGDPDGPDGGNPLSGSNPRLPTSGSLQQMQQMASGGSGAPPAPEWNTRISRCREAFFRLLRGPDVIAASAAIRALMACVAAKLPQDVMVALGLTESDLPGAGVSTELSGLLGDKGANSGSVRLAENSFHLPSSSGPLAGDSIQLSTGANSHALSTRTSALSSAISLSSELLVDDLVRVVVANHMQKMADDTGSLFSAPIGGRSNPATLVNMSDVVTALLDPVARPELSADALAGIGWLLEQLLPPRRPNERRLPPAGITALCKAADAQRARLRTQLQGPWADALLPLAHLEWPRLRPTSASGTLTCSATQLLHFLTPAGAMPRPPARALESSAVAAVTALACVSRSSAFAQMASLLATGSVAPEPPLPAFEDPSAAVEETALLDLTRLQVHGCRVSFRRGEERAAVLTALTTTANSTSAGCTSPHAVLLAPASRGTAAGHVLSAAPLLSAAPAAHPQHRKWLMCQVRPTVNMLQETLATARRQGLPFGLSNKAHQLGDGAWVLAFDSPTAVVEAVRMLEQAALKVKAAITETVTKLHPTPMFT